MAHTAEGAHKLGVDDQKLDAVWDYQTSPLFTPAERAALDVAVAAGCVPNAVTDEMFIELASTGARNRWSRSSRVIAMFGFLNRWNDTFATPLEDEPTHFAEDASRQARLDDRQARPLSAAAPQRNPFRLAERFASLVCLRSLRRRATVSPGARCRNLLTQRTRGLAPARTCTSEDARTMSRLVADTLRIAVPAAAAAIGLMMMATGHAQFGTAVDMRQMAPTVEDSDPGVAPDPGAALPEVYRRTPVRYRSDEAPGTLIVDTPRRFLYLVQNNGIALRYGIGVGRDGFQWNGLLRVTRKSEWPDWTPPPEMIKRQPYLPRFMAGGPGNPMGARALYLGQTIYRIHGTNAPHTIGHAVSSGCFRLVNSEIEDLYSRVAVGAKVIVQQ